MSNTTDDMLADEDTSNTFTDKSQAVFDSDFYDKDDMAKLKM